MNKKAISAIVATVLIILITVAAVTIIWSVILPMISGNLEKGQICLEASSSIYIKSGAYTCKNSTHVKVNVLRRADNVNLKEIILQVVHGGSTSSYTINETMPSKNGAKVYAIPITKIGSGIASTDITGLKIAPVLTTDSGDKLCDATKVTKISNC